MRHISEEHLNHWREHGYCIVNDVLTPEELAAAQKEIHSTFPSPEEYAFTPTLYRNDFRGGHMRNLPFLGDVLNFVAVDPEIISFVERALGTQRIALAQSLVWARYPEVETFDYPLHVDYMSSSILYPNAQGPFVDVSFILYYVDVDEHLGATRVVSKQHSKGELLVPVYRTKSEYLELYKHEQPVYVRAGSMLIYNMMTFHRMTDLSSKDRTRYSHHIIYRSEDAQWVGYSVWANSGQTPELHRFLEKASPRQRELFGFPPPGHAYWNEETLTGVAARYPLMDMTPYLEGSGVSDQQMNLLGEAFRQPRPIDTGIGGTDYQGKQHTKESEQSATDLIYHYCCGAADYYAAVTGVPAGYWLPWLLAYTRGGM